MAENTVKEFKDQLRCSICHDTFIDPKQLECHHEFCQNCLETMTVNHLGQISPSITCPICRKVTTVPTRGVAGLQSAFRINRFLDIIEKAATNPGASAEKVEGDSVSPTTRAEVKLGCLDHDGKKMELFCETCEKIICWRCIMKGGRHHSHDYEEIERAFENYKFKITAELQPMEKQLATTKKALAQLDACHGEISHQQMTIEADIHRNFDQTQFCTAMDLRRAELIHQLQQMTQEKLKALAVQRNQIETQLARVSSCLGFIKESLDTEHQKDMLIMKTGIFQQVKELTTPFPSDKLKPNTEADMAFSTLEDISATCQKYGQITSTSQPDPSKCYAVGKGIESATVGEISTIVLQAIDFKCQPCKKPVQLLQCELVSEITGNRTEGTVEERRHSQYKIIYQPAIKGRYQLHIKVNGQHITGSPFSVTATLPVEKLSIPIGTIPGLEEPKGVSINQRGEVVVSEYNAHRVSIFSPSGEKLRDFGTQGSGEGQFHHPYGVTIDDEGNILVTDHYNHRIQKFTIEGKFLAAVKRNESGSEFFTYPAGIVFNFSNKKIYVSDHSHHVHVFNSDLSFSHSFEKPGGGQYSVGIACAHTGIVYMTDYQNHRIYVFTAEGDLLRVIEKWDEGRDKRPDGIAIDANGMVYVCEAEKNRVIVFDHNDRLVKSFGKTGKRVGEFRRPRGIFVNSSGVVYVCDSNNNRIQMF